MPTLPHHPLLTHSPMPRATSPARAALHVHTISNFRRSRTHTHTRHTKSNSSSHADLPMLYTSWFVLVHYCMWARLLGPYVQDFWNTWVLWGDPMRRHRWPDTSKQPDTQLLTSGFWGWKESCPKGEVGTWTELCYRKNIIGFMNLVAFPQKGWTRTLILHAFCESSFVKICICTLQRICM